MLSQTQFGITFEEACPINDTIYDNIYDAIWDDNALDASHGVSNGGYDSRHIECHY
jgi:hypothetical protein